MVEDHQAGLTLKDALEAFADAEDWEAWLEEQSTRCSGRGVRSHGIEETDEDRERLRRARHAASKGRAAKHQTLMKIIEKFDARIRSGDLIATGYRVGADLTSEQRTRIPPDIWSEMTIDWARSSASCEGFRFNAVRVTRSSDHRIDRAPEGAGEKRRSGRPSIMDDIVRELRRRDEQGEIAPTVTQEAKYLVEYARAQYSDSSVPQMKTIRKRIGSLYREIEETKRSDK